MSELSYAHGTGTTALLGDTIGRNLDRAVGAFPEREALVDVVSGRRWTYAGFGAAVRELARGLMASGVAKGDRVGIWAVNCPEWVLVQYATAASAPSWSTSTRPTGCTSWSTCSTRQASPS